MGLQWTLPTAVLVVTLTALCPAPEGSGKVGSKALRNRQPNTSIDEPRKPFTLRAVRGIVLDPSGAEMDGVIVEIRDEAGRIRGTKTNRNGPFKLGGVPKLFSTTIQV